MLIRADWYTALGGRFAAPSYDVASGNPHLTDTGYANGATEWERAATAAGVIHP